MSEMTSVEQFNLGEGNKSETVCNKCHLTFESSSSLDCHLKYHHADSLMNRWPTQEQTEERNFTEESNNNNSKQGNHNNHPSNGQLKFPPSERVTAPADSSESPAAPAAPSPSDLANEDRVHHHPHLPPPPYYHPQTSAPGYSHPQPPEYNYLNEHQNYQQQMHQQHQQQPHYEEVSNRHFGYHPYLTPQYKPMKRNSVSTTTPRGGPLSCDKCGLICSDYEKLSEHCTISHGNSPAFRNAFQQQPNLHHQGFAGMIKQDEQHFPMVNVNKDMKRQGYDFKCEIKQEQEEQAELLDLDSHKVHHRFEDEGMRIQAMHMHQQQQQQQSDRNAMMNWPTSGHEYHHHVQMSNPLENVQPLQDPNHPNHFAMRNQQPLMQQQVEPPRHQSSPLITSTQTSLPGHQMSSDLIVQNPKPPPLSSNQSWKSNEARRPKTYHCSACNKWFTSSGHLKRHYNTTLHKNAVKQSNKPDPANTPISNHHHPARDPPSLSSGRGHNGSTRSPELAASSSPPNLMAGPLGEATRGLLHTPSNFNNNSSGSNSDSSQGGVQQPISLPLATPLTSVVSSMTNAQMGCGNTRAMSANSTTPMASSPMHLNSPSMEHMSTPTSIHHQMASSTVHQMGGLSMPLQPHPNALPPHVTFHTSTQVLQSISQQQTITGNTTQETLPGFKTIHQRSAYQMRYESTTGSNDAGLLNQNNVGGLSPEDPLESNYTNAPQITNYPTHVQFHLEANNNLPIKEKRKKTKCQSKEHHVTSTNTTPNYISYEGTHKCIDCNKQFNKACYLTQHNKSFHSGDKPFKCNQCGKRFPLEAQHAEHLKKHAGEKPYKCEVCPKQFNHKTDLRRHQCLHSGAKPYVCQKCGKGFIRKDHMMKHYETHKKKAHFNMKA